MPITQSRFMQVLRAASTVLQTQQSLIPFARDFKRLLDEVDEAAELGDSAKLLTKARAARGYLYTISELLLQANLDGQELFAIVHAEKKYFDRHARYNDKAAEKQRRRRANRKGHLPAILPETQSIPENPPHDAEAVRQWQSGAKASEVSPMLRHLSGMPSAPTTVVVPDPEVAPDADTSDKDIVP